MATAKKQTVKKNASAKTQPKAEAPAWSTIHIFGYGESQIIGKNHNGKAPNELLKNIAPLLQHLEEKQEKGTEISMEGLHALNIFNNSFVGFMPKGDKNKGQRFAWSDVDAKLIDKLANELVSKIPEPAKKTAGKGLKNFTPILLKKKAAPKPPARKEMQKKAAVKKVVVGKIKK